jgi:hypothetical protein
MTSDGSRSPPLISPSGVLAALGLATIVLGSVVALLAGSEYLAKLLPADRDAVLTVALGLLLAILTLAKPWWFWQDLRVQFLRTIIGDVPTTIVYLGLATALIGFGGLRARRIAQAKAECAAWLVATPNMHKRLRILRAEPSRAIPGLGGAAMVYTCGTFQEVDAP